MVSRNGFAFVISAPSGAGKTSIVKEILRYFPEIVFSVSVTTRKRRENETDGKDYFFISEKEFEERIKLNEFIEWERFFDTYYGTLRTPSSRTLSAGKSMIFDVDVKGALSLRKEFPEAVLIYIMPPGKDELLERLKNRKTEHEAELKKRMERAQMELDYSEYFDFVIRNENLSDAVNEVRKIISNKIKGVN